MYVIIAPIQIKPGFKDQFITAVTEDAQGSVRDEPGCLRFDVIQDANDVNRIWLYEVYKDEAAFQAHTQAPHFLKFRDTIQDWRAEGPQGAGRGASNIWPPDSQWK
jgi:(4S)-4-hydroxy-5-phosphonooxypentane-2,3-dione isomerase